MTGIHSRTVPKWDGAAGWRAGGFEAFFVARVVPQGQQDGRGRHKGYYHEE
jgi:hypothetical protein